MPTPNYGWPIPTQADSPAGGTQISALGNAADATVKAQINPLPRGFIARVFNPTDTYNVDGNFTAYVNFAPVNLIAGRRYRIDARVQTIGNTGGDGSEFQVYQNNTYILSASNTTGNAGGNIPMYPYGFGVFDSTVTGPVTFRWQGRHTPSRQGGGTTFTVSTYIDITDIGPAIGPLPQPTP